MPGATLIDAEVERSVVFPDATFEGTTVRRSIIDADVRLEGVARSGALIGPTTRIPARSGVGRRRTAVAVPPIGFEVDIAVER